MKKYQFLTLFFISIAVVKACKLTQDDLIQISIKATPEEPYFVAYSVKDTLFLTSTNALIFDWIDTLTLSTLDQLCVKQNCTYYTEGNNFNTYALNAYHFNGDSSEFIIIEHGEAGLVKRYKYLLLATIKSNKHLGISDVQIRMTKDRVFKSLNIYNKLNKLEDESLVEMNRNPSLINALSISDTWGIQSIVFFFNSEEMLHEVSIRFDGEAP